MSDQYDDVYVYTTSDQATTILVRADTPDDADATVADHIDQTRIERTYYEGRLSDHLSELDRTDLVHIG